MKLTRSQLSLLLLAILTVAIGVVTNVATGQMPIWLQHYLWLSWPILGLLAVLFIALSVHQARQESVEHLRKHTTDRKALCNYLEQLTEEHKYFSFLERAKPLDLEKIYIALKVGEYVPRQLQPDESVQADGDEFPKQRSGTVEVPEAIRLHHRLAILGEPGSGKTTLLKYLALRIAQRDPSLGEFARESAPQRLSRLADRIHRRLATLNISIPSFILPVLGFWIWGLFHSPHPLIAALIGLVLAITSLIIFVRTSKRSTVVCAVLIAGLLTYCAIVVLVPPLAIATMALLLVLGFYPYWVQPPLAMLNWLRERSTRYPLPLYLTLNDMAGSDKPLESHLAGLLDKAGFAYPQRFLQRKLDRGECLVLLDALDEVVDEAAYRRVADDINRFAITYRNQIIVTCRIAGFRGLLQGFLQLEVQEFNQKQVELFIENWFADSPTEERKSRVDGLLSCLGRSARMRLLAANPLLLSIISLLYEHNLSLPERRVELYEECAQILLEKRETEKRLQAHFPSEKKRSALQSAAAHFHQKGVRIFTKDALLTAIADALPSLGYSGDRSSEFLQELMERSSLLRQKSRTSYDFSHLTFQEFFTAVNFHEKRDAMSLLTHLGDPWWREVILLFVGLEDDATLLLERLREHDILLAAAALADARMVKTEAFKKVADEIIAELKRLMEEAPGRRQEAVDALAEISRYGATEYLVQEAHTEKELLVALAAVLGLARAADRAVLNELFAQRGPILRLLNGSLGRVNAEVDGRILSLLETLGFPMVFVPAGEFLMGSNTNSNERPPHQVYLDDYWIDKYPVTNDQFQRFMSEKDYQAQGNWRSEFTPGKENHPVVNVTWDDASAFCEWAGKRLPTEAQWEKAARGADGRVYPWGNQWDGSRCNASGRGTTPVDQYPNGVSPYGCYDMGGNVDEWCEDWHDKSYYASSPKQNPTGPSSGATRVLRGGSWGTADDDFLRTAYRTYLVPTRYYYYIGFRCAGLKVTP